MVKETEPMNTNIDGGWYEASSDLSISKATTMLDRGSFFDSPETNVTSRDNMENFIENYGVKFELPAIYVMSAKFYPADPTHML